MSSLPTAVVTGAGNGLGAEIARALARRGHHVVVTDVDLAAAESVAAEIGGTARRLDVADRAACLALTAELPDLGVWVNNAGLLTTGPSWETDEARRRLLFDVNVHGTMNGTEAALERFLPAGRGHVVNIVSTAGLVPAPHETIYGATKYAALSYSIGTHLDLRLRGHKDIRISALCPDGMWTPMLIAHAHDPDAWPSWSGSMLMPEDVARHAVALLDRPRIVRTVPRWRGVLLRLFAAFPAVMAPGVKAVVWDSRRKQRAWAKRQGL